MVLLRIKDFLRSHLPAFVAAFAVLFITFFVYVDTSRKLTHKSRSFFSLRSDVAKAAVEKRLKDYEQILKALQSLYKINDTVTLQEWKTYVRALGVETYYPGIQGIGYTAFVPASRVPSLTKQMRDAGFPGFQVWPTYPRAYYSSILYLEPSNFRNQRALGFDMYTEPTRQRAMRQAMDSGAPALSGTVTLVQETDHEAQKGFLLYLPVYRQREVPATVAERRKNIQGFVYSPFRVGDLMRGIFSNRFVDLRLRIYDSHQADSSALLFDNRSLLANTETVPGLHKSLSLRMPGHTWLLEVAALADSNYIPAFPNYLLWGGSLLSVMIFIIMYFLTGIRRSTYLKQLITDNATAGLFILNHEGCCTFMNPAASELTGYSEHELRNERLYNLLQPEASDRSPDISDNRWKQLKRWLAEGDVRNHSDTFFHKSGTRFYVNINGSAIRQYGSIIAYLIELRDVSQLVQHEQMLEKQNVSLRLMNNLGHQLSAELDLEKLLQAIVNASRPLIGATQGVLYYWADDQAPAVYISFETSPDSADLSSIHLQAPAKSFCTLHPLLVMDLDSTEKTTLEPEMPLLQLPIRSYLAVPIVSRNGHVTGGLYFGHPEPAAFDTNSLDIIKGISAQASVAIDNSMLFAALSLKNDQLTKTNNDLDTFVYTASHDLKAPMLNIEGLIQALHRNLQKQEQANVEKIIQMINLSVQKFKETVLALTQVAAADKQPHQALKLIDFNALVDDVCVNIQELILRENVEIHRQIACSPFLFSEANLRSVMMNLVTNAIKYRVPNRQPVLHISCIQQGAQVVISVQDNGLGIPDRVLPKVFMMFKRFHNHVEGTGVGLFLVKRLVDNCGGKVKVESTEGQGSTFTVTLPVPTGSLPQAQLLN